MVSSSTFQRDQARRPWPRTSRQLCGSTRRNGRPGPALVGPYSDDATRVVLDALVPENCVVFDVRSSHDDAELVSRERWHGASYDEASLEDNEGETVVRENGGYR